MSGTADFRAVSTALEVIERAERRASPSAVEAEKLRRALAPEVHSGEPRDQ